MFFPIGAVATCSYVVGTMPFPPVLALIALFAITLTAIFVVTAARSSSYDPGDLEEPAPSGRYRPPLERSPRYRDAA